MKKLIFSAAVLASAFFAASCQQELLEPQAEGNTVTYTVEVPEVATKAIGEGNNVNQLIYAVYRVTGETEDVAKTTLQESELMYQKDVAVIDGKAIVPLELIKDQSYLVLFWAQVENKWFGVDYKFGTAGVKYPSTYVPNSDDYAAFSNVDYISVDGSVKKSITLTRPFGQLNIATNLPDPALFTPVITGTQVTVEGAANYYDVATGKGIAGTLEFASIAPINGGFAGYDKYLSMNYVFVPDQQATVSVSYVITTESHGTVDNTISNVPVKKNYKTNIVGKLLTSDVDYNVTLEKGWGTPDKNIEVVSVASAEDLQEAIDNIQTGAEGNIILEGDIDLNDLSALIGTLSTKAGSVPVSEPDNITIPAGKTIILDLNGYTLAGVDETEVSFGLIKNQGILTIVNSAEGKIGKLMMKATHDSGWSRYSSVISCEPGSTLTVGADVEIEHLGGTSMAYGIDVLTNGGIGDVTATIDGATVKSTYRAIRQFLNSDSKMNTLIVKSGSTIESTSGNKSIWMQDPSAKANLGTLEVESDANLNDDVLLEVTPGSTEWPVFVSIADSALKNGAKVLSEDVPALYDVVLKDGYWTVESSYSFGIFVEEVIAAEGNYDGEGKTVKILPLSGKADNTNSCLIPNRLQKYTNPEVFYAQYQRFAELQDVNISNVNFIFVPSVLTVQDAWNTAGATTTAENVNGELQFMNTGSVTLTNCTFDKVAVSPFNATSLTVADCQFDNLMAYAIKDINAATTSVTGTEFNNCNGGFWFNAAPTTVTATDNTFTTVGRRGAIQFSAAGNYSNTTLEISGNEVDGAFLWQLNKTITASQIEPVISNNTFTTAYVEGSIIPAYAAKIGDIKYDTLQEAADAANAGDTITVLGEVEFSETLNLPANSSLEIKENANIKTIKAINGATIIIEDGKTLALTDFSFGSSDNANAEYEIKGGTLTANYGFFQHGTYALRSNFETGYMYYSYGSDITVYGTFHSKGAGDGLDYVRGNLTIAKGGKSIHDKTLWVGQPASWGAMEASLTIKDGGYVQANSLYVYEGSSLTYYNNADLKYNNSTFEGTITAPQQDNEIWYTATALVHAHWYKDNFGEGTDLVSNKWNETTGKGVITLSGPVTKVAGNTFYDREALISISFPNSVKTIGDNANSVFSGCANLTTVEFGSNVQFIGKQAFTGCDKLTNVVLPESLTTIGESAFNSCTALKTITIPAGVTSIGDYAFNGISDLKVYCKPSTPPTVGSTPFNKWWAEIYVPAASLTAYQEAWGSVCDNIYAE